MPALPVAYLPMIARSSGRTFAVNTMGFQPIAGELNKASSGWVAQTELTESLSQRLRKLSTS